MSPRRKKAKRSPKKNNNTNKRENDSEDVSRKRAKVVKSEEEELKARKKKNFIEACRQVSCNAYSDHRSRLLLYYLPSCMKNVCKHQDKDGIYIKQMPHYAEESFTIEMKNNTWYEALEVCQMCITPVQYLSANVLKEVVEIILACIIGKETKKCLYLGVRNKYCYTCQYYERTGSEVKSHGCCKNFTGPSTAMESNIIVEGFQRSEKMHNLRYLHFIGDGDSSVFANLKGKVSYGNKIMKIECKNHVIKNYTSALYKNVHEDVMSEHSVSHIIDKCQQILLQNFSTHPPCLVKTLRSCYQSFLIDPMDLKEKTYTNRTQFECRSGIVKYCMNRLENEISSESQDGPLINKYENIPEEMKQSLKGLHWQKEKFEIFELLDRPDRIERLMAVLESVIELLQFDLAIWNSRYTNNITKHIMRSHKPLMAFILWSDNVLYTGAVTANCRQILRVFVHLIHLQYPESMIRIITIWLNIMVQTFYICEINPNADFPNIAKYSTKFANEFYKIISEMPFESINRILDRIEPPFMKHLVGLLHIKKLMQTNDDCIVNILITFFKESQWLLYPPNDTEIEISNKLFFKPKKTKKLINYVIKQCQTVKIEEKHEFAKFDKEELKVSPTDHFTLDHLVHTLYITLEAYLETYDAQSVKETWNKLNEQVLDESQIQTQTLLENSSYDVTEELIKKYKHIMTTTKELQTVFHNLKSSGELPDILDIFTNITF